MIPINDLSRKIRANKDELGRTAANVFSSGSYILGSEVSKFEDSFSSFIGTKYCVGVASGSDALKIALTSAEIGVGSNVITVSNAGMYSSNAILAVGATPIYVDIDASNMLLDFNLLLEFDSENVDALIVTHLFGLAHPKILQIAEWCKERSIVLIEDCAQAHGASIGGQMVGTFGEMSCFSFYPTKNLGALGDAGAVLTSSTHLRDTLVSLRQYGWKTKYHVALKHGMNSRLDEMQAAILNYFLPSLEQWNNRRRQIANFYSAEIDHPNVSTPDHMVDNCVSHLYVTSTKDRKGLIEHLAKRGIGVDIHYPIPDHMQIPYQTDNNAVSLPVTEQYAQEILTIPCFPELTDYEAEQVVLAINEWQ
jgi:dTDP-4-amino-4,6-dideoxygalactose transaminase